MIPALQDGPVTVYHGDAFDVLREMPDESVHCVLTSPPYWSLRDYNEPGQLGLEKTPDEYVENMVRLFREVRRVLRSDGTCWLNLGDSYASGEVGRHDHAQAAGLSPGEAAAGRVAIGDGMGGRRQRRLQTGLKPKDLVMMPARVAMALQADGWWIRSDIAWTKAAPMPESVTDRPVSAWEHIFLLTKSPRYFFDQEAVREPSGASQRNVWHLGPEPYSAGHFAVFPSEIPLRAIKAGTSEGGACPHCGAPWRRYNGGGERVPGVRRGSGGQSLPARKLQVPDLRGEGQERAPRGEYRAGEGPGEGLPGEPRGEHHRAQTEISGKRSRQAVDAGGQPQVSANRARTCSPTGGPEASLQEGASANSSEAPHKQTTRAAPSSGRDVHPRRLDAHPQESVESLLLLQEEVHDQAPANDGSCDPVEPGRVAQPGEHRGRLPTLQRQEVEPLGVAPVKGWEPTCACGNEATVPCTVLDPFAGSGTTLAVARRLGRRSIGIELSQEDIDKYIRKRISEAALPLLEWLQEAGG